MAKKITHTTIRNQKLFCGNCGGEQVVPYPIQIPMMTAMIDAFNKMHRDCKPEWRQPVANPVLTEYERAVWWSDYGEHGTSSKTIFSVMSPFRGSRCVISPAEYSHPYDSDDFRRCHGLLLTIPEWRNKLDRMRDVSDVWSRLVDNWDLLAKMLEEQIELERSGKNSGNEMDEFMKSLRS